LTSYLECGVFTELKDLAYFHRVENRRSYIEWPNGQDLCGSSIYHSMVRLRKDQIEFVDDAEMDEIDGNLALNRSVERGIQDALTDQGCFLYQPEQDPQLAKNHIKLFDTDQVQDEKKNGQEIPASVNNDFLAFSQILMDTIGSLSEREFFAGWKNDIEFELWDLIHSGPKEHDYIYITQAQCTHFKLLSQLSQGWIHFGAAEEKKWIPLNEWRSLFAAWKLNRSGIG